MIHYVSSFHNTSAADSSLTLPDPVHLPWRFVPHSTETLSDSFFEVLSTLPAISMIRRILVTCFLAHAIYFSQPLIRQGVLTLWCKTLNKMKVMQVLSQQRVQGKHYNKLYLDGVLAVYSFISVMSAIKNISDSNDICPNNLNQTQKIISVERIY